MRVGRVSTVVAVAALVLTAAACGSSDSGKKKTTGSGPQTYTVETDLNRADLNLPVTEFATAFYPKAVSVHPGDSVSFKLNNSGEPHTAALGSLIDGVAVPYSKLTPAQKQGDPPPAIEAAGKKVPQLLPDGPGDAIQAAAQPCYQATGLPPTKDACAVHTGDFTGSEALVSSGWLDENAPWTLKVSASAKPGTYNFFCQLHGPDMGGTLTVVDKATTVKSPSEVAAEATTELKADAAKLAKAAAAVQGATADKAVAGQFDQDFQAGGIAAFGPTDIKIPVGGSVTWTVFGPHSLYFNAPASAQSLRQAAPDGSVHLNVKAASPAGGPGAPDKPGLFDGGKWDGVGEHSTGLILSFPPDLYRYKLTFTKAGTYTYLCSVHTNMKGTVTVG
jgi:plastocyanin